MTMTSIQGGVERTLARSVPKGLYLLSLIACGGAAEDEDIFDEVGFAPAGDVMNFATW